MTKKDVEEIEYLAGQFGRLAEAVDLAAQVSPNMLPDLRRLRQEVFNRLKSLVHRVVGRKPSLGAIPPRLPLELVERFFAILKAEAENAHARASRLEGTEAKRAMREAIELGKLASLAAESLMIAAHARGVWTREYMEEHGLEAWIPKPGDRE